MMSAMAGRTMAAIPAAEVKLNQQYWQQKTTPSFALLVPPELLCDGNETLAQLHHHYHAQYLRGGCHFIL